MSGPLVLTAARYVLAVSFVIAAALLVKGYTGAGDGFAAGAVVAVALGLQVVAGGREQVERVFLLRHAGLVALAGLVLALASGFFPIATGDPPFTHLPAPGEPVTKVGSVELATALLFDVGVFLLVIGAVGGILALLADPRLEEEHG